MRPRETVRALVVVLFTIMAGGSVFAQEPRLAGPDPDVVPLERLKSAMPMATVGGEVITLDEVQHALRDQLAGLERQHQTLLRQKLEQLIGERLLAREAKKRGLTVEQLLKAEVYANAPEVTDAEMTAFIMQNRALLREEDDAKLRPKVLDYLRSQKIRERAQAYIQALRAQTGVTIDLEALGTTRRPGSHRGPVRGPSDAPVAIVEFADFQCASCKSVLPTIKQFMDKYPEKVKWVFRDFPIRSIHPTAPKGHEAARCAAEQGKFWEYHDVLYDRAPRHSVEELKQYAQELQLDAAAFSQCLDSGKYKEAIDADVQEGIRLGVSGTPTFFINARALVGAQPLAAFETLIDKELANQGPR